MTLDDSADLLDRIQVDYRNENYDENYDESFGDNYDETYDDSAEFFPFLPNPINVIGQGLSTVGRILSGGNNQNRNVQLTGVRPNLPYTGGIQSSSNLLGQLTNQAGRNFQFRLPPNVATKEDIATLKKAVDAHNVELKKVSDAVTKNAQETAKIASEVNRVDAKHIKATQEQNKVMRTMGTQISRQTRRVNQLNKELRDTKQQSMMLALLPMMMGNQNENPKLTSLKLTEQLPNGTPNDATAKIYSVTDQAYKEKEDDNSMMMMVMVMMMSSGMGGSGGGNDMMLPLMVMAMNK